MAEAATQLAKQIFNNKEVRIFGTPTVPLFVAVDVGAILGIANVHTSIAKFENYKKDVIRGMDVTGRSQDMTVLTESGLYSLALRSKKPVAREFERWLLTEVLPSLRKEGKYEVPAATPVKSAEEIESPPTPTSCPPPTTIQEKEPQSFGTLPFQTLESSSFNTELIIQQTYQPEQSERQLATITDQQQQILALESRLKVVAAAPPAPTTLWDLYDFHRKPCIYIYLLRDIDYKFGRTCNIIKRNDRHQHDFRKYGCEIMVSRIWACASVEIMEEIESRIKQLSKHNGWYSPKYDKHEIITCPDISFVIARVDAYIKELTILDERAHQMKIRELALKEAEMKAKTDIKIQMMQLENEGKRLELERAKFEYFTRLIEKNGSPVPQISNILLPEIQIMRDDDNLNVYTSANGDIFTRESIPAADPEPSVLPASATINDGARVRCACGKEVNAASYSIHLTSKLHARRMKERPLF